MKIVLATVLMTLILAMKKMNIGKMSESVLPLLLCKGL